MDEGRTDQLVFFAFDLLFLNGQSTAQLPLIEREMAPSKPSLQAWLAEAGATKLADRPYAPSDRGIWVKSKCLNREEFVVVGWTDPEGSRSHIGALLLGYYTDDGRLHYAGRAGTGITDKELKRLAGVLKRLQVSNMSLAESPPRDSRFGSPLNLLRQVSYQGEREDKPATEVVRAIPHPPRSGVRR
jgi:bifunctional non-homologous end joining protein LigD